MGNHERPDPVDLIDLDPVIRKLCAAPELGGYDWPRDEAVTVAMDYRLFLKHARDHLQTAHKINDRKPLTPPSRLVDIFWHTHILFTHKYFKDCEEIYGHYLHHEPILPNSQ